MDVLLEQLVARGVLREQDARKISEDAFVRGVPIEEGLKKIGVSDEDIAHTRDAGSQTVPVRNIENEQIPYSVLQYIPEESARHYQMVPLGVIDGVLEVGFMDPGDLKAIDTLGFIARDANMPYKIYQIQEADFQKVLKMYSSLSGEVGQALSELETELSEEEQKIQKEINQQEQNTSSQPVVREDAPMIKIVATVLRYAVDGGASDVHIEKTEEGVKVRFRVDGILHTSIVLPRKTHQAMVARIKVLASMRLDERRKPQDGRFSATIAGRKVDFRVSTFPAYDGEKIVMRILDRSKGFIALPDLNLSDRNLNLITNALQKPHGLILISGPTGSGKSTTLYSMLSELDAETKNILSLEDPVEYHVSGVNQSQVRPEIGYTFANGLRTTLRQDPDVIMVGEIRDGETAKLAIQAALTGHLVLSTIHTNSAVGVIPRLIDMGVDPYLIAPTLVLAIAQRLVRRVCADGGADVSVDESMRAMIQHELSGIPSHYRPVIPSTVKEARKTPACPNGTRGRLAVMEVLSVTDAIRHTILKNPTEDAIMQVGREDGMLTMKEDAIIKAFSGKIPFDEVKALGGMLLSEKSDPGAVVANKEDATDFVTQITHE
jgi:type IV pilus assembly protein PilB